MSEGIMRWTFVEMKTGEFVGKKSSQIEFVESDRKAEAKVGSRYCVARESYGSRMGLDLPTKNARRQSMWEGIGYVRNRRLMGHSALLSACGERGIPN